MSRFKAGKKIFPLILIITSLLAIAKLAEVLLDAKRVTINYPPAAVQETPSLSGQLNVPILIYHHLKKTKPGDYNSVAPEIFQEQMNWLKANGYQAISYSRFYQALTSTSTLPAKAVVISFDDGLTDQYRNGLPVLKQFGWPAIFFVNYHPVSWFFNYLNEEELKDLINNGMEIGSHGLGHKFLTKLNTGRLIYELRLSKLRLEQILGQSVDYLAYPNGRFNDQVIGQAKAAGYRSAVTDQGGVTHERAAGAFTVSRISAPNNLADFIKIFN